MAERERESGVYLTVLGCGTGNLQDATMEPLAERGNGQYAYIDTFLEARRLLVEQLGATLRTVAKDVKLHVEFNPAEVKAYRPVGYESRRLRAEEFNDDRKDAGYLRAGHSVTVLEEVTPAGKSAAVPEGAPLNYQRSVVRDSAEANDELLRVKVRYKDPGDFRIDLRASSSISWTPPRSGSRWIASRSTREAMQHVADGPPHED